MLPCCLILVSYLGFPYDLVLLVVVPLPCTVGCLVRRGPRPLVTISLVAASSSAPASSTSAVSTGTVSALVAVVLVTPVLVAPVLVPSVLVRGCGLLLGGLWALWGWNGDLGCFHGCLEFLDA